MKPWPTAMGALLLLANTTAPAATAQDHRCLSGGRNDGIHLEWRWLDDGQADVRYAGQRERLLLRRVSMETTVLAETAPTSSTASGKSASTGASTAATC